MSKYQQKMAKYYNKRVKLKRLDIGDLVIHKGTSPTKDPTKVTLQGHPLPQTRQLSPKDLKREKAALTMEHRAFEEVPSIDVTDN